MDDFTAEELERFRELINRANREIEEKNNLTKETSEELETFNKKVQSLSSRSAGLTRGLTQSAKALGSWVSAVDRGERGFSASAGAVESLSSSASAAVSKLGPLGKAVGNVTEGLGKLLIAVGRQADEQFSAYRGMQRFGAAANDGLEGIRDTLRGFRMTEDQLQDLVRMLEQQSVSLGLFQGTVFDARQELASISTIMETEGIRENLMRLGLTAEDISEAMVDFVALQSDVGVAQRMNQRQLANATEDYLKEFNALTKATGIQREEAEETIRQMRQQERFRAFTDQLRAEGQEELALSAERAVAAMSQLVSPEAARGLADLLAGDGAITSPEAQRMLLTAGVGEGDIQSILQEFRTGRMSEEELLQTVTEGLGRAGERLREAGLPQLGVLGASGAFMEFSDMARAGVIAQSDLVDAMERAREEQENQITATERNVERAVELQNAYIDTAQSLAAMRQSFMSLNELVLKTSEAMARLAGAAEDIVDFFSGGRREERGAETRRERAERRRTATDGLGSTVGTGSIGPETFFGRLGFGGAGTAEGTGRGDRRGGRGDRRGGRGRDGIGIEDKVSDLVSAITQSDATISDLVRPYQGDENWVGDISAYLNMSPDDVMPQTPEEIGKLAMALAGKQVSGEIQAGEDFRHEIRGALRSELGSVGEFEQGGVASGPTSGFFAELHGTEAVIPLNGGSIPVTISNLENQISGPINQLSERLAMTENMITETANRQQTREVVRENSDMTRTNREQLRAMQDQVSRLDRLINVSESNNNIMSKILQNSHA